MAADPIIYCLQQLTDYPQFERLCSDAMAGLDYPDVEPLGGHADKGRDAIFISRTNPDDIAIFAYTVRQDWQRKLKEDSGTVHAHGHASCRFIFVCTASLSANDKDAAKKSVADEYGWDLVIYDLERLRVELTGRLRHLLPRHPHIFCAPWFPTRGGVSIAAGRDLLVIDHVPPDHAIATWLSRRLQLAGYATWCLGTAPLAGETADETVRLLISNRARRFLPILSPAAIDDCDFISRCGLAANEEGLIVPCYSLPFDISRLASRIQTLVPVRFDSGWAGGMKSLLDALEAQGVPKDLDSERGEAIALRSFFPEPVTIATPEPLYASVFPVSQLPTAVCLYRTTEPIDKAATAEARKRWAFSEVSPNAILSFHEPPPALAGHKWTRGGEWSWSDYAELEGKRTFDVIKELLRRCLEVACHNAGLKWCSDRNIFYFPQLDNPQRNVAFTHVDGSKTRVAVTGVRQFGYGDRAKPYHYQLAPIFRIGRDETGTWWVTTRVYVRVTDTNGTPLAGKTITSRRKHVAKSWWNQHWFARTLGVMQALSGGASDVSIGDGHRRVVISTHPMTWQCPVSIDAEAVDRIGDFQEEMAALRYVVDDDDGDEQEDAAGA